MYTIIFLSACICMLILYMIKEAFGNYVLTHTVVFSDLPKSFQGMTIFFISDIHRRSISSTIIDEIKGKADYVFIGGDLAERGVPTERIRKNLLALRSVAPVYFVWGNNDYEVADTVLASLFQQYDIVELNNDAVRIHSAEGEQLAFVGIKDWHLHQHIGWETEVRLERALADVKDVPFKILMAHKPQVIEKITPAHEIQLVLSGHTHGGQIHLLGYSPYERGNMSRHGETVALISNGYGTTSLPLRLGAKAETHLLQFK